MLLEPNWVRVDDKKLQKYLNLSAIDNSISMSKMQIKAVDRLFELGYKHGFYENLIISSLNLIPTEYLESRNA